MQAHCNPILDPRAKNWSRIWNANSRVGVITRQANRLSPGEFNSAWITGIAKAAVLPEPVSASPITSLLWIAIGMDFFWIGVGLLHFKSFNKVIKFKKIINSLAVGRDSRSPFRLNIFSGHSRSVKFRNFTNVNPRSLAFILSYRFYQLSL